MFLWWMKKWPFMNYDRYYSCRCFPSFNHLLQFVLLSQSLRLLILFIHLFLLILLTWSYHDNCFSSTNVNVTFSTSILPISLFPILSRWVTPQHLQNSMFTALILDLLSETVVLCMNDLVFFCNLLILQY